MSLEYCNSCKYLSDFSDSIEYQIEDLTLKIKGFKNICEMRSEMYKKHSLEYSIVKDWCKGMSQAYEECFEKLNEILKENKNETKH